MQTYYTLASVKKKIHKSKKKTVFVTGTFDILHVEHLKFLRKAKTYGDILIVGISSDKLVQKSKGQTRPIIPEGQRAELINALKCVDYVFISSNKRGKAELVIEVAPDVAVTNISDLNQSQMDKARAMRKRINRTLPNTKVVFLKSFISVSTSKIINKICTGA